MQDKMRFAILYTVYRKRFSAKVTFEWLKSILKKGTASVKVLPIRTGNVFNLYQFLYKYKEVGILGFHNDVG